MDPSLNQTRARFSAVAAMASNRVIGRDNRLPWHLPEDFQWFKRLTRGSCVVMGRKTYDSLDGALPDRRNVILSRSGGNSFDDAEAAASVPDVLTRTAREERVFIIGGAEIYAAFMPYCGQFFLTHVHRAYAGDRTLPPFEDQFPHCEEIFRTPDFTVRRYAR